MILYFGLILILEMIFIIVGAARKKRKCLDIFNGLFFGTLISLLMYYIYIQTDVYSYDTGEWSAAFGALIVLGGTFIANAMFGVIGLILQIVFRKKNLIETIKKGKVFKWTLLVSLISFAIIFSQFSIKSKQKNTIDNEVKDVAMTYLMEKYGTDNFECSKVARRYYEVNGFIGTDNLDYYELDVVYLGDNTEFRIQMMVDEERKILKDSLNDNLMFKYYKMYYNTDMFETSKKNEETKLNNYFKTKQLNIVATLESEYYDSSVDISVPNNYGKIPTKEELYNLILDYHFKHRFQVTIDTNEIKDSNNETELKEYLIKLSNYIIEYYGDLRDYRVSFFYQIGPNRYHSGVISINKDYIELTINGNSEEIKRQI